MHLRRACAASAALGLFAAAPSARSAATPKYSELPVGRATSPPTEKGPTSIRRGETAAGWFSAIGPSHQIMLALSQEAASSAAKGSAAASSAETCFEERAPSDPTPSQSHVVWSGHAAPAIAVWQRETPFALAVHAEQIVEQGGRATLESTDVWVDPGSRGVRLRAKETLPLARVGTAPGGVTIYLGRDERADGQRFVELVLVPASHPLAQPFANGEAKVTLDDGTTLPKSLCRHLRVALPATPGGAASASIQLNTVLSLSEDDKAELAAIDQPKATERQADVRVRPLGLHFAVSQASRDTEPLVSVGMGWAGPGRSQRVSVP